MFIRVQEKQVALKQYSLLSQSLPPTISSLSMNSYCFEDISHPSCPKSTSGPTAFHRPHSAEGNFAYFLSAHRRWMVGLAGQDSQWKYTQAGQWRARRPWHVFFQLIEDDSFLSQHRGRRSERQKLKWNLFFCFFAFDSARTKTSYIWTGSSWAFESLLLAKQTG